MLSLARERDHHRGDLVLLAGGTVAALADIDAARLAPRHGDDLGRDKLVVEHDIGALQRAQCLQRNEIRIARAGADQGNATHPIGAREDFAICRGQEAIEVGILRCDALVDQRTIGKPLPEAAASMERQMQRIEPLAPGARSLSPGLEARRQQRLETGADRLAEHRRRRHASRC